MVNAYHERIYFYKKKKKEISEYHANWDFERIKLIGDNWFVI